MNIYLSLFLFLLSTCVVPCILYQVVIHFFKWKQHQVRTISQHANELSVAIPLSVCLFFLANLEVTFGWITVVTFLPTFFLYGFVSEQDFAHHSFVTVRNWSWKMWVLVVSVGILVCTLLGYHLFLAHQYSQLGYYFIRVTLIPLFLGGSYVIKLLNNKFELTTISHLHFHHYQLFFFISFLPIFDDVVSQISMGLALAPFMQGIASYGPDSIFS
jgi:hypothetical protein